MFRIDFGAWFCRRQTVTGGTILWPLPAPAGVDWDPCRHFLRRVRVGPTGGRKRFMLLVDSCAHCSRIMRSAYDLSWREYDWVRRWNLRK